MRSKIIAGLAILMAFPPVLNSIALARQDSAVAPEPAAAPSETPKEEPARTVVKPARLAVVETVAARVESASAAEIRIDMDQWTDLEVVEVVPQGTAVRKGQPVLRFKIDDFQKRMAQARIDLRLAEIAAESAKAQLDYAIRTSDLDREIAESSWAHIRDDHRFWMEVRKPLEIESTQRSLRNSEFSVEYAQEELNQLEKMYAEDELTEESEKIVLERTRRELENSEFWLKRNRVETERELTVDLPRQEEEQNRSLRRGELDYNRQMIEIPAARSRAELEFERSRLEFQKQTDEFHKLESDFAKMVLHAPTDGMLYHGEFDRGNWSNKSGSRLRAIRAEDELTNDTVVMTVLDPAALRLRCDLSEAQAAAIRPGQQAVVTFTALPGARVTATVDLVSPFPVDGEHYDCQLSLATVPAGLRPGMNGEIKVIVHDQADALLVAKSSVFTDNEGISHYVFVLENGKPARRQITVGREHDDKWQVLAGLQSGDRILDSRPDDEEGGK